MLLSKKDTASAMNRVKPSRGDFALCELSAEDKDKFLDEHNKFRGMVDPPAADMEYMVRSRTNSDARASKISKKSAFWSSLIPQ